MYRRLKSEHGITMIELVSVISILLILALIAIPVSRNYQNSAARSAVEHDITRIVSSLESDSSTSVLNTVLNLPSDPELLALEQSASNGVTIDIIVDRTTGSYCVEGSHERIPTEEKHIDNTSKTLKDGGCL